MDEGDIYGKKKETEGANSWKALMFVGTLTKSGSDAIKQEIRHDLSSTCVVTA